MKNKNHFLESIDLFNFADVIFVVLDDKGEVKAINKKVDRLKPNRTIL